MISKWKKGKSVIKSLELCLMMTLSDLILRLAMFTALRACRDSVTSTTGPLTASTNWWVCLCEAFFPPILSVKSGQQPPWPKSSPVVFAFSPTLVLKSSGHHPGVMADVWVTEFRFLYINQRTRILMCACVAVCVRTAWSLVLFVSPNACALWLCSGRGPPSPWS